MVNPNFDCLIFIIVYSDLRNKVTSAGNTNNYSILNEKGEFGEYIKQLLPNINQPSKTITILANCTIEKDELNPSGISKSIELFKLISGELLPLDELSGKNITQFKDLKDLFEKVKLYFDCSRRLVFTYGHGSVFGIFAQTQLPPSIAADLATKRNFLSKSISFMKSITNIFKSKINTEIVLTKDYLGYENDYISLSQITNDTNNLLSNEELAEAVRNSFGTIDILIMNNCLMQNVYAQTAFRKVTKYLIAPQSGITFPGFDLQTIYDNFLINSDNSKTSEQITNSFANSTDPITKGYAIIAFDLENYDAIIAILSDFKKYLSQKLADFSIGYSDILFNSLDTQTLPFDLFISNGVSMFDILQWTKHLQEKDTDTKLSNIVATIEIHLSKIKNFTFFGDEVHLIKKLGAVYGYSNKNISGLCVYFPITGSNRNGIIEKVYDVNCIFEKSINWKEVLDTYTALKVSKTEILDKKNFIWKNIPA